MIPDKTIRALPARELGILLKLNSIAMRMGDLGELKIDLVDLSREIKEPEQIVKHVIETTGWEKTDKGYLSRSLRLHEIARFNKKSLLDLFFFRVDCFKKKVTQTTELASLLFLVDNDVVKKTFSALDFEAIPRFTKESISSGYPDFIREIASKEGFFHKKDKNPIPVMVDLGDEEDIIPRPRSDYFNDLPALPECLLSRTNLKPSEKVSILAFRSILSLNGRNKAAKLNAIYIDLQKKIKTDFSFGVLNVFYKKTIDLMSGEFAPEYLAKLMVSKKNSIQHIEKSQLLDEKVLSFLIFEAGKSGAKILCEIAKEGLSQESADFFQSRAREAMESDIATRTRLLDDVLETLISGVGQNEDDGSVGFL